MDGQNASNRWSYRDDVSRTVGSTSIDGYQVEATDGDIGKIDKANSETGSACLVVDTGFWIFGKKRLLPAGVVREVDHENRRVRVNMTKDEIKNAPDYDETTSRYDDDEWRRDYDYYDPYFGR